MFEIKPVRRQQKRRMRLRVWVAALFVLLCFGVLGGRLWVLQIERYESMATRANNNRIAVVPITPRRGEIFDRNGKVLAHNVRDYTLMVTPAHAGDLSTMLDAVGELVSLSPAQRRRFTRHATQQGRYTPVLLRNKLTEEEAAAFAAQAYRFPGVELGARWVRVYPYGESAAHVLGYVGQLSEQDFAALEARDETGNYRGTSVIGKKGVEKTWERTLHGRTGLTEVEVTATGRPVRLLHRVEPEPGENLVLSLDIGLQQVAEAQFQGRRGALVAIAPRTGEVLALVSAPAFDPNLFIDGIDEENWQALNNSPDHPLMNRALAGTYPIGSTYKPFVALAALELGKRSAEERVADPGYFELAGQRFRNAGSVAYGPTNMHRAIVVSSDTYFYSLGPEIGINALHDFSQQFGFGQLTGIDLDGERRGILPSTQWKRQTYKTPEQQRWYTGETVSVAVGQGYNAFTLLQLAQATSVLANNGVFMQPHIVQRLEHPRSGRQRATITQPSHIIPLKPQHLKVIHDAMADVLVSGTARHVFQDAPYRAAGKTGTAQVYGLRGSRYNAETVEERLRDHALFIAWAPVEDPQIALALIVENEGWGAAKAAPIARTVMDYWLTTRPALDASLTDVALPPPPLSVSASTRP